MRFGLRHESKSALLDAFHGSDLDELATRVGPMSQVPRRRNASSLENHRDPASEVMQLGIVGQHSRPYSERRSPTHFIL